MECKHPLNCRQAVASADRYGAQLVSVVCVRCGKIIYQELEELK